MRWGLETRTARTQQEGARGNTVLFQANRPPQPPEEVLLQAGIRQSAAGARTLLGWLSCQPPCAALAPAQPHLSKASTALSLIARSRQQLAVHSCLSWPMWDVYVCWTLCYSMHASAIGKPTAATCPPLPSPRTAAKRRFHLDSQPISIKMPVLQVSASQVQGTFRMQVIAM